MSLLHRMLPATILGLIITGFWLVANSAAAPDLILPDGSRYFGSLEDGRLHGVGRLEWLDGSSYQGEFAQGLIHGQGQMAYASGDRYEGEFVNALRQGQGRYVTADGRTYEGRFENNRIVEGTYSDDRPLHYTGSFDNWRFHGQGVVTDEEGNKYSGVFEAHALNGRGELHAADGSHYVGEFRYNMPHGEGVRTFPDGRAPESGRFVRGELAETANAERRRNAISAESLLYNQPALLAMTFDSLLPTEPERINAYLLAVGGDGREEVFRRETEFIAQIFDTRLGTAGRSVMLINSRTSFDRVPLATATSIGYALDALTERMDPDNDILFVYLTSHGSPDHQLVLSQRGIQIPHLEPEKLQALIRSAPVRWKVVIVSACFSGGLIESLADDHTLVITASRADRTSFGCSDDAELTYFADALFANALANTNDLIVAFNKAAKLVKQREADEGIRQHSEPQMHAPVPVRQQLARWRNDL